MCLAEPHKASSSLWLHCDWHLPASLLKQWNTYGNSRTFNWNSDQKRKLTSSTQLPKQLCQLFLFHPALRSQQYFKIAFIYVQIVVVNKAASARSFREQSNLFHTFSHIDPSFTFDHQTQRSCIRNHLPKFKKLPSNSRVSGWFILWYTVSELKSNIDLFFIFTEDKNLVPSTVGSHRMWHKNDTILQKKGTLNERT